MAIGCSVQLHSHMVTVEDISANGMFVENNTRGYSGIRDTDQIAEL